MACIKEWLIVKFTKDRDSSLKLNKVYIDSNSIYTENLSQNILTIWILKFLAVSSQSFLGKIRNNDSTIEWSSFSDLNAW